MLPRIYQLEITNRCNLKCGYCPRKVMKRKLGVISEDTLKKVVAYVKEVPHYSVKLHHFGESFIHFDTLLLAARFLSPYAKIELNTNGTLLSLRTWSLLAPYVSCLWVSLHKPVAEEVIRNVELINDPKIKVLVFEDDLPELRTFLLTNVELYIKRKRDLGGLNAREERGNYHNCAYLKNFEVAILYDGTIVRCCECYDDKKEWVLGHIDNIKDISNKIIPLCKTCLGYGNWDTETELVKLSTKP